MGSGGELDSGQHQAGAGPMHPFAGGRERLPAAAATHGGDVGEPALRHEEGPADGRRRQPFRKRKARTGVRVRSSLPPPCSVGPAGVDARLSSGRSRVQVPYGARMRCAVRDRTRPHEVVAACRILSPVARVQVPVGVRRGGDRCPGLPCTQARWGSIPHRSTSRYGGESVHARMKRMWTRTCLPCRRQPVRGRSSARS